MTNYGGYTKQPDGDVVQTNVPAEGDEEVVANSQPAEAASETDTAAEEPQAEAPAAEDESDDVKAARDQAAADRQWRAENPGKPLIREANPAVGGEGGIY